MNPDMSKLMQKAQEMQKQVEKMQQEKQNLEVIGESGAGLVKVVMTGKYAVKKVTIDPSILSEEKEILEDLVAAAVNDAVIRIEEKNSDGLSSLTEGLDLPPGFKLPF